MSTIAKLFTITPEGIELHNTVGYDARLYHDSTMQASHFVNLFNNDRLPLIPYKELRKYGLWNLPMPNSWKLEGSGVTRTPSLRMVDKQELTVYLPKNKNGEDVTVVVINEETSSPFELSTRLEVRINDKVISHRRYVFDNVYKDTKVLTIKSLASLKQVLVNMSKYITENTNDALGADKLLVMIGSLFARLVLFNRSDANTSNYLDALHEGKHYLLNNPLAEIVECADNSGRVDFGIKSDADKLVFGVSISNSCKHDKINTNNKHEYYIQPRTDVVFTAISDLKQLDEPNPKYTKKRYVMKGRFGVISSDDVLAFIGSLNNMLLSGWGEGDEYLGNAEDAIMAAATAMGLEAWTED